jgi:hypothetical protein
MRNLRDRFCYSGSVETNLYIKFSAIWNPKLNVLTENIGSQFLSIRIGMAI